MKDYKMSKINEFFNKSKGAEVKSYACGAEAVKNPKLTQAYKAINNFADKYASPILCVGAVMVNFGNAVSKVAPAVSDIGIISGGAVSLVGAYAATKSIIKNTRETRKIKKNIAELDKQLAPYRDTLGIEHNNRKKQIKTGIIRDVFFLKKRTSR